VIFTKAYISVDREVKHVVPIIARVDKRLVALWKDESGVVNRSLGGRTICLRDRYLVGWTVLPQAMRAPANYNFCRLVTPKIGVP
jgi:hypothetical protein